jgi:predicted nucleotidyltransferase
VTDINTYLSKLSTKLSIQKDEKEKIDKSISFLIGKIWERFQDRLDKVEVFGSYDRGTALSQNFDKSSDVDILIIFKTNDYQPETFLKHLNELADKLYSRSDVSPDHPAITIVLDHVKFELVPAYWQSVFLSDDQLKIPAPRNKEIKWITTNPLKLKSDLNEKDSKENNMVTRLIKIIKYFNALNGKPYDSYVIEKFSISRSYPRKEMKDYFFEFINDLDTDDQTEIQQNFVKELKTRRQNLIALDKLNLIDYIELELQKFIPFVE